ncbi:MAG: TolC family protein [Planctomycetaceae bacterium]
MQRCIMSANSRSAKLALRFVVTTILLLSIPACRIPGLRGARPSTPRPESFNLQTADDSEEQADDGTTETAKVEASTGKVEFHQFFDDPLLTSLIDQAFVNNQELKILAEDIQIARNEVYRRRGAYLPFGFFGARAGLDKPSAFSRAGAVEENLTARGHSFPEPLPEFLVAANVSWEIDIWKKLRNAQCAAYLRYLGTAEGRNYVATRLIAEISGNYYELVALDKRLETLDRTIALQEESLRFAKLAKDAGRGTELAVQRFEAEVRKNQSEKLIIAQDILEAENRINFLTGRYPQAVERKAADFFETNIHPLSAGVPSELLRNRSDIRSAERKLQAAGLDIRVARARFYPSLIINAGVGYNAFDSKYLFSTPESLIYNLAGDVVAPLINRNAIKADYYDANAEQLQAVYDYQQTVLNAFTEVINRMSKVDNYGKSLEIKRQQLEALEASVDVATKLFQNARAEYVDVLLAQRDLQDARMVIIETKKQQLTAVVDSYQALGGGIGPNYNPDLIAISR